LYFFPNEVHTKEVDTTKNGNNRKKDLKSDFDRAAKTTLCKLDTEKTLQNPKWISFFQQMNQIEMTSNEIALTTK